MLDQIESGRADQPAITAIGHALAAEPRPGSPGVFVSVGEHTLALPEAVIHGLRDLVQHLSRGTRVQVVPMDRDLSLTEGAAVLGVSREYLRRLVHRGEIPSQRVGAHHRITLGDLLDYRNRLSERRNRIIHELHEQSVELGAYDDVSDRHDV